MDKYSQILEASFGEPLKLALAEPIKIAPVRIKISLDDDILGDDSSTDDDVCPECGMMMIDGECNCDNKNLETCPVCGMSTDKCECKDKSDICSCGMMNPSINQSCSCGK